MPISSSKTTEYIKRHKDGSVWAKGTMQDGSMVGYWKWYRKDGVIMRSGSFENGEQVGEWTTYDKAGRVLKITIMKHKAP